MSDITSHGRGTIIPKPRTITFHGWTQADRVILLAAITALLGDDE